MWKLNDTTCVTLPKLLFRITHANNNNTTRHKHAKFPHIYQKKAQKLIDHIFPLRQPHFASVALIWCSVRASRSDFRKSAPAGIRAYYFTYWPSSGCRDGNLDIEGWGLEKALGIFAPGERRSVVRRILRWNHIGRWSHAKKVDVGGYPYVGRYWKQYRSKCFREI